MIRVFASPVALLTERAKMMREEVAVGHLRLVQPRERTVPERWRPIFDLIGRNPLVHMLSWVADPKDRPLARVQLEDMTLESAPPLRYLEEDGRLHSTGGPAVEWADGLKLYCLRGVPIPPALYKRWRSGKLRPEALLQEPNQSVMSVLLEQMDLSSLLTADGVVTRVLDHDERWGTLRTIAFTRSSGQQWLRQTLMTIVEVVNRSPEPDGTFRHYWLQVDAQCRPILRNGFGLPQALTALNAVASTFAMTGEAYAKTLGDES